MIEFINFSGYSLNNIARAPIDGGNEGCVTEQSGFLKNVQLNNFLKIAYLEWFS